MAYFAVSGDILGSTLSNIDKLLQIPTGCGEQNMLNFAPDVFITKYLRKTQQLKPNIEKKALNMMLTGYQREMTFIHADGSFSAFGELDKEGSIWLTVRFFVSPLWPDLFANFEVVNETL